MNCFGSESVTNDSYLNCQTECSTEFDDVSLFVVDQIRRRQQLACFANELFYIPVVEPSVAACCPSQTQHASWVNQDRMLKIWAFECSINCAAVCANFHVELTMELDHYKDDPRLAFHFHFDGQTSRFVSS